MGRAFEEKLLEGPAELAGAALDTLKVWFVATGAAVTFSEA